MNKEEFILRKTQENTFIFYNPNRTFKSEYFETRETRDKAIDKYIENCLKEKKEQELKRITEYKLTHE